jgi:hypothetical protein
LNKKYALEDGRLQKGFTQVSNKDWMSNMHWKRREVPERIYISFE